MPGTDKPKWVAWFKPKYPFIAKPKITDKRRNRKFNKIVLISSFDKMRL
jgi:hypothetical protein